MHRGCQRFMEAVGKSMLRDFFRSLERELAAEQGTPDGTAPHDDAPRVPAEPEPKQEVEL